VVALGGESSPSWGGNKKDFPVDNTVDFPYEVNPMVYCQVCKKNIAAVHYTEIDADYKVKKETHMCEACAQAQGLQGTTPKTVAPIQVIENLIKPNLPQQLKDLIETRCEICGMTYPEFRATGRLGCPADYKVFKDGIRSILDQVQGGARKHIGKIPKRAGSLIRLQAQETSLRDDLNKAITVENYEKAAKLRDALKQIEQDLKEMGYQDDGV